MARVRVRRDALAQARELDGWWRRHHEARPQLFKEEWNGALGQLAVTPSIGPSYLADPTLRRLLLRGSQFYVYYLYDPPPRDQVIIVAVWSTRRGQPPPLPR